MNRETKRLIIILLRGFSILAASLTLAISIVRAAECQPGLCDQAPGHIFASVVATMDLCRNPDGSLIVKYSGETPANPVNPYYDCAMISEVRGAGMFCNF